MPVVVQVSTNERLELIDGVSVAVAGARLRDLGADGIGLNCSVGPQFALEAVERLMALGLPVTVMPNAGLPHKVDDRLIYVSTPDYFARFARRFYKLGVKLVGGCCGTTPEHVKKIAGAARMEASAATAAADTIEVGSSLEVDSLPPPPQGVTPTPLADKSRLAARLGKHGGVPRAMLVRMLDAPLRSPLPKAKRKAFVTKIKTVIGAEAAQRFAALIDPPRIKPARPAPREKAAEPPGPRHPDMAAAWKV